MTVMETVSPRRKIDLLIAAPRGFCAGVDRAIRIVELALERYGAPVYVRHEIVHNRYVVDGLKAKGAVFVEHLDDVPDDFPVIFSAHGVRSEEHTSELQSLMRISYAVFCLKKKKHNQHITNQQSIHKSHICSM